MNLRRTNGGIPPRVRNSPAAGYRGENRPYHHVFARRALPSPPVAGGCPCVRFLKSCRGGDVGPAAPVLPKFTQITTPVPPRASWCARRVTPVPASAVAPVSPSLGAGATPFTRRSTIAPIRPHDAAAVAADIASVRAALGLKPLAAPSDGGAP